jgi:hypothetical protein
MQVTADTKSCVAMTPYLRFVDRGCKIPPEIPQRLTRNKNFVFFNNLFTGPLFRVGAV